MRTRYFTQCYGCYVMLQKSAKFIKYAELLQDQQLETIRETIIIIIITPAVSKELSPIICVDVVGVVIVYCVYSVCTL